jgi:membrane-bound lytic murein transglycosylase D
MRYNAPMWWFLFLQSASPDRESEIHRWQVWLLTDRQAQTDQSLLRSRRWVSAMRPLFAAEGVPEDLVWMALIESGFRAGAENPSGAVGMFQFKRETAAFLGLRLRPLDERKQPLAAAAAAARYLRYLYAQFADWDLVLAAYNLGEGDVRRALVREGAQSWEQVQPHVRAETQVYVAKVWAAARVGNEFLESDPRAKAEGPEHTVASGETLYSLSRRYGVGIEELCQFNGIDPAAPLLPDQVLFLPQPEPFLPRPTDQQRP